MCGTSNEMSKICHLWFQFSRMLLRFYVVANLKKFSWALIIWNFYMRRDQMRWKQVASFYCRDDCDCEKVQQQTRQENSRKAILLKKNELPAWKKLRQKSYNNEDRKLGRECVWQMMIMRLEGGLTNGYCVFGEILDFH